MVCSADDLALWKDFPKGLRVLLYDEDGESAADTKVKLEAMDYIVYSYCKEEEALEEILRRAENYHIAIVEVTNVDNEDGFKLLEMVKGIPTIAISRVYCLNTVMKCISLGAAEFLQKPLSHEKLGNIWQHVVHKAFDAGGYDESRPSKIIKDAVVPLLKFQASTNELKVKVPSQIMDMKHEEHNVNAANEEVVRGGNLTDFQEQSDCLETEYIVEAEKSAKRTKAEDYSSEKDIPLNAENEDLDFESLKERNGSCLNRKRGSVRRRKVDWTLELHAKFVQAIEKLGADQAIPSKILQSMRVEGLTRHSVASHLQKFRMRRRHILPKGEDRRWRRDYPPKGCLQEPIMAFPPYSSDYTVPASHVYPIWPRQSFCFPDIQRWSYSGLPAWLPPLENWQRKSYPEVHAEAWGCPILPHHGYGQYYMPPQGTAIINSGLDAGFIVHGEALSKSYDVFPAEEVIDEVVKEAMSKPWLPLPLGLKSPSTEKILAELHHRGIYTIPPPHHRHRSRRS